MIPKRPSKPNLHKVPTTNGLLKILSSLAYQILQYRLIAPPSLTGLFWHIPNTFQAPKHSLHYE